MQVILLRDVDNVGESGQQVNVAEGFYRNFLSPRKLAVAATKGAMADLKMRADRIKAKQEKQHQENLAKAEKIQAIGTLTLHAAAGEGGKLFGAITNRELAKVVTEKVGFEIDRKNLVISQPIHEVGTYAIEIKLSTRVKTTLSVAVQADEDE